MIWTKEFIDFSNLLITYKDDNNYTFQLQSNEIGQQVLSMLPNHKRSTIPGGGTLGISGCAAGTMEPLASTRASSAEFCYPILEETSQIIPNLD